MRPYGWNRRSLGGTDSNRGMHAAARFLTRGVPRRGLAQSLGRHEACAWRRLPGCLVPPSRARLVNWLEATSACACPACSVPAGCHVPPGGAHHSLRSQRASTRAVLAAGPHCPHADRDRERSCGRTYSLAHPRRLGSHVCSLFRCVDVSFRRPADRSSTRSRLCMRACAVRTPLHTPAPLSAHPARKRKVGVAA